MKYADMTKREQLLLRNAKCPICNNVVDKLEDVQIVKIKYGRRVISSYIHSTCLLNSLLSSQLAGGVENAEK